jgi:hypothetical protein
MTKKIIPHLLGVCAIILLMTIQPVAATTTTLSPTQKTALEKGIIFHQEAQSLFPIYTFTSIEKTSSKIGDRINITGTIQIFLKDSFTRDEYFSSFTSTDLLRKEGTRNLSPDNVHVSFEWYYFITEQGVGGDPTVLTPKTIMHVISIDALIKDQLQANISMEDFRLGLQQINDKGFRVDQNIQTQTIEIIYIFEAILIDRSNIVPPITRVSLLPATNTTSTSSIPETNSIDGYSVGFSLFFVMGGIFICILGIRSRKNRDPEIPFK